MSLLSTPLTEAERQERERAAQQVGLAARVFIAAVLVGPMVAFGVALLVMRGLG